MEEHVRASTPREACGVLAGERSQVHWVEPITNVEESLDRFRMDPQEQVDVMMRIEDDGLQLIGIYHSHPEGPDQLSESDIREAAYLDAAHLVWTSCGGQWSCRAFIIEVETAREIPILISDEGTHSM
jgi:proteasome lid subunit RPN8/RPN11